jgi:hypothetical protein
VQNHDVARDIARVARSAERFAKGLRQLQVKIDENAQQSDENSPNSNVFLHPSNSIALDASEVRIALARSRAQPTFGAPDLFGNALWSLMLELLLAEMNGEAVPVSNACISLGGPQSTALRLLNGIEKRGVVVSHPDPRDGRRRLLGLPESVKSKLMAHLAAECSGGAIRFRVKMKLAETDESPPGARFNDEGAVLLASEPNNEEPILNAVNIGTKVRLRQAS